MPRAVRLSHVQNTHLASAGLQQHRAPVVVMRQHLQEMLGVLQQAVVDVEQISRPQLQVQLQHNGLGVLSVQQPGAPQLRSSAPLGVEKIRRGERAVKAPEAFAAAGVGAAPLVASVGAVGGTVAAQGGRQTVGGLSLCARQGARGAETRVGLRGRWGAASFVRGIAAFVLPVALPGARETLPIPAEELVGLTAALTQVACKRRTFRL